MDTGSPDTGPVNPNARRPVQVENGTSPTRDAPLRDCGLYEIYVDPTDTWMRGERRGGLGANQRRRVEESIKRIFGHGQGPNTQLCRDLRGDGPQISFVRADCADKGRLGSREDFPAKVLLFSRQRAFRRRLNVQLTRSDRHGHVGRCWVGPLCFLAKLHRTSTNGAGQVEVEVNWVRNGRTGGCTRGRRKGGLRNMTEGPRQHATLTYKGKR